MCWPSRETVFEKPDHVRDEIMRVHMGQETMILVSGGLRAYSTHSPRPFVQWR